jgi:hypothetical protein
MWEPDIMEGVNSVYRDSTGKYLTAVGRDAVMQARNRTIGKDELFTVEDSQPQVFFTAHNGKMVSIKQGRNYPFCVNLVFFFR